MKFLINNSSTNCNVYNSRTNGSTNGSANDSTNGSTNGSANDTNNGSTNGSTIMVVVVLVGVPRLF